MADLPLIVRAARWPEKTAVLDPHGAVTYGQLLDASARVASCLLGGASDLNEARVTFIAPSGFHYVAAQWGIWRAGGIAVPLCDAHPRPELEYVVEDCGASIVLAHPDLQEKVRPIALARGIRFALTDEAMRAPAKPLPNVDAARRAMMLYTSGTTGKPKGVVTTHRNIEAQTVSLVAAWEWTERDRILHVLPLHHIHGIINILTCAMWAGATCEMMPRFDAQEVWRRFMRGDLTLFMAVPTVYAKLIAAWEAASAGDRKRMSEGSARMRLMVSGSAALPVQVLEKWKTLTGHVLLERYGMTEIGMALSNPLRGERRPGFVGAPLPGAEVRLVDEQGNLVPPGAPGEIEVRGPIVFLEYWNRPEATAKSFRDGWFRTGDVAVVENGYYRILGRSSVDIIKTGGYKVSAIEIEETLRQHPAVHDCAVVGLPDAEWGERVCAAVVLKEGQTLTLDSLRAWARERVAVYKIPSRMLTLPDLPRNPMGKVTKPKIVEMFKAST